MQEKLIEAAKARFCVSDFKELKYEDEEYTTFKNVLDEDLEEVAVELMLMIDKINDPCCDNYRIYPEHMFDEFNDHARKGCCGSHDWTFITPSGNTYLMGFNFGH